MTGSAVARLWRDRAAGFTTKGTKSMKGGKRVTGTRARAGNRKPGVGLRKTWPQDVPRDGGKVSLHQPCRRQLERRPERKRRTANAAKGGSQQPFLTTKGTCNGFHEVKTAGIAKSTKGWPE